MKRVPITPETVPAVGDVVEFRSNTVDDVFTLITGTVTRVWTNGKYVSIKRTGMVSLYTRCIENVNVVMKGNGHG